LAQSD